MKQNIDKIQVKNERIRVPIEFQKLLAIKSKLPKSHLYFFSTLVGAAMR